MSHDVGDVVTVWAVFRDETGVQTAPGEVTLRARRPDHTFVDITPIAVEAGDEDVADAALPGEALSGVTGVYRGGIELDYPGLWWYGWHGAGAITEHEEGYIGARVQRVPPAEES